MRFTSEKKETASPQEIMSTAQRLVVAAKTAGLVLLDEVSPTTTTKQKARAAGYDRVWDLGCSRWVYKNKNVDSTGPGR